MQIMKHDADGPHKLLRIETQGCAVNVLVGLHDDDGNLLIAVEVEPAIPDEDGNVWEAEGNTTIVVKCLGRQSMPIDLVGELSQALTSSDDMGTLHVLGRASTLGSD